MKKLIVSLLIIAFVPLFSSCVKNNQFKIFPLENTEEFNYRVNDFYSIYYVYMNVIRALKVDQRLSPQEVEKVVIKMVRTLKANKKVQLQVSGYQGGEDLRITLSITRSKKNKRPILLLVSNYDPKSETVVSSQSGKDPYATFFYFKGDKLVKYQYVDKRKTKGELKKRSVNSQADYYLLDESPGNDALGKKMLIEGIKKGGDKLKSFIMNLTLSEYYLLEGNTRKAEAALNIARKITETVGPEVNKSALLKFLSYGTDIYRLYTTLKNS